MSRPSQDSETASTRRRRRNAPGDLLSIRYFANLLGVAPSGGPSRSAAPPRARVRASGLADDPETSGKLPPSVSAFGPVDTEQNTDERFELSEFLAVKFHSKSRATTEPREFQRFLAHTERNSPLGVTE